MAKHQASTALELLEGISSAHGESDQGRNFGHWLDAVTRYRGIRRTGLLDIACDAANLSYVLSNIEDKGIDPLAIKAIQDTNPALDLGNLPSGDALTGAINVAKGKYFEYKVVERLNKGERVGDIILPDGYRAILADSVNQPGWDVKIIDTEGRVSDYLQLKATDSISYVRDALERYPDIRILATDEVADQVLDEYEVLDSDISDEWLTGVIEQGLLEDEAFMDAFLEAFSPIFPLAVIAGTEGYQLLVNRKDIKVAISECATRGSKSLASQATRDASWRILQTSS
jgi:hypothetical protein